MAKEKTEVQSKRCPPQSYPQARIPANDVEKGVLAQDFTLSYTEFGGTNIFFLDVTLRPPPVEGELLVSRIMMAPATMKLLCDLLDTAIKSYEKMHGEIKLPKFELTEGQFKRS
jgi:hypothetical protein